MEKITKTQRLYETLERFKAQYKDGGPQKRLMEKLENLPFKDVNAQKIYEIIGNESWARLECYECGSDSAALIRFNSLDYEGSQDICEKCLDRALQTLRGC